MQRGHLRFLDRMRSSIRTGVAALRGQQGQQIRASPENSLRRRSRSHHGVTRCLLEAVVEARLYQLALCNICRGGIYPHFRARD